MRRSTFIIGAISVLIFVGAGIAMMGNASSRMYAEAGTIGQGNPTFAELSDRFTALAEQKGAVYAFDVLRVAPLPPNIDLHLMGHVVGDILYKQKGLSGIADCTQDFRNACSHAVVIGTLNEFGDGSSTISKIRDACHLAPGGLGAYTMCFHGLGHGVFAYYAYDLKKTIAFCTRAGDSQYGGNDSDQCIGGAIMELVGGGGHDHDLWLAAQPKYFNASDPLSPCMSSLIPEGARSFCLQYLTPRLFERAGAELADPDPATFPAAFAYCDVIPKSKQNLRDACFGGFGKEFIPLAGARDIRAVDAFDDAQYREAASWCEGAVVEDGKAACIKEALGSVFWGGENDPAASFRFCSNAPLDLTDTCNIELSRDIRVYLQGAARKTWCDKLPSKYQSQCATDAATPKSQL